jgi:uncharacterized protein (DUF427 family)
VSISIRGTTQPLGLRWGFETTSKEKQTMKVVRDDRVLAESDQTIVIEGNHYFPPESIRKEYFQKSDKKTTCPWKGQAGYYHIVIGSNVEQDAAWYYPEPKAEAREIKNYVAFNKSSVEFHDD